MAFVLYIVFRFLIVVFYLMPFRVFYLFSDFISLLLNHVIRYRRQVVIDNLHVAFPDKSEKEIGKIANDFYKNLADIILESIRGNAMSEKQLLKRFVIENRDAIDKYHDQGREVIVLAGHNSNWEWGAASTSKMKHKAAVLYKPLSNKYIDSYIRKKRARFGVDLIPITQTKRYFLKKKDNLTAYIMVADQSPSNLNKAIWIDYFGKKTAFLHGPQNYTDLLQLPVVFFNVNRERRGYYRLTITELTDDPSRLKGNELTKQYAKLLEKNIRKYPEEYIWSHRRWKHKFPPQAIKKATPE